MALDAQRCIGAKLKILGIRGDQWPFGRRCAWADGDRNSCVGRQRISSPESQPPPFASVVSQTAYHLVCLYFGLRCQLNGNWLTVGLYLNGCQHLLLVDTLVKGGE